ncbi:MAG TPA: 2OG-Fe(II) oxygenase [Gammaproteobacteria bacterium]|jgi:PKHD-type hydroxylase|nr:2OG-Fe(II) oxygenase [Gammaproteobacteria bacterium]
MASEQKKELPQFQPFATASGFLTDTEIDRLLTEHASLVSEGKLAAGNTNANIRRSQVVMLGDEPKYHWLYDRIWAAAQECNRLFFCVDIVGVETNLQLGRYDSSDRGFYDWHTDFAGVRPLRKLSISIQLSRTEDYDGGDLELMYGTEPQRLDRTRGAFIVFPSFVLHRVTPVTRGTRWSLVAWIGGARWR